jgi:magnesium transporter
METLKGKVSWVNIMNPKEKDLLWLKKKYSFHPLIIDELRGPSARSKVEINHKYLYLIYYFPIYDPIEKVSKRGEIDFLITKKGVITVSYEKIEIFQDLIKTLNIQSRFFEDPLRLTHKLIESLLIFQQRQINHIREKIDGISAELFKDREKERERELLERISYIKRDIAQYRTIVHPQKRILDSFFKIGCEFLGGSSSQIYFNDLEGEFMKILDQLDGYREAIEDFETTNNELINIKNAQVVKTFTILAFLTFPMMLFAALFSMNVKNTPIVGHNFDFWIILGVMAVAMIGMYSYFRNKDWL